MKRITVRALLTAIVMFLMASGVIGIIWLGARDVVAGVMTPGEMGQFVLYAMFVAMSAAMLSEVWGELQRAAGATERLVELLTAEDPITDPAAPAALPSPLRGEWHSPQ